jgi:hypothetical protein
MKWTILLVLLFLLIPLAGCSANGQIIKAGERGWDLWEKQHQPVVADADYDKMTPEEQSKVIPQSKYDAEVFEMSGARDLFKAAK